MTIRPGHIAALALSALIFLTSCRKDEVQVIPRSVLSRIYAEMLLTDQWIMNTPTVRGIADTSLVYEPILEKYGYDSDDYRKSVDVYMDDPERFAKIFRETVDILTLRRDELVVEKERLEKLKESRRHAEKFRPDIEWKLAETSYDSLVVELDSSTWIYRLGHVPYKDTSALDELMVPKDTVATKDTVAPVIEVIDTLIPVAASRKLRLAEPGQLEIRNVSK